MPRVPSRVVLSAVILGALVLAAPAWAGPLEDGQKALAAKDWTKAAEAFRKALATDAAQPDAAIGLARAAVGGGSSETFAAAEEALHAAIEAHPERRDARLALGDLFLGLAKTKTADPQAMKFIYEDAKTTFRDLVEADASDEAAVTGLARTLYETAFFDEAVQVVDAFLAAHKSKGPALYWKGQVLYLKGQDAYRAAGEMDEAAKAAFRQAMEAYEGAAKADPTSFDAWMQLGYSAQYLGETDAAQKAYERAMDLEPRNLLPLKGIEALYAYRAAEYPKALQELARTHPSNVAIYFFLGYRALTEERWDDAARDLERFERQGGPEAAFANVYLAKAWQGKGDWAKAERFFTKALEANPDDAVAAAALDKHLRDEMGPAAADSPQGALAFAKAYEPLFQLAPRNIWIRNNVAFLLREAATPKQNSAAWRPVLDACVRIYDEAAKMADDQIRGRESQSDYTTRHSYAGVINDAGLMYQYYPAIVDLERAESMYQRSLELTDDGYIDAFTNLAKILGEQQRWEDLYELAASCAEMLKQADGSPHETGRSMARGMAQKLVSDGKVER